MRRVSGWRTRPNSARTFLHVLPNAVSIKARYQARPGKFFDSIGP